MSEEAVAVVEQLWEVLGPEDIVAALADDGTDRRVRETLARIAEVEFEVHMRAPAEHGLTEFAGRGADGFRKVWAEWMEPFQSFRIEFERRLESAEEIVDLVRLIGTTRTGGVPIEEGAAAVWTVCDGKLTKAEFYLDRGDALRATGFDPDRPPTPDFD